MPVMEETRLKETVRQLFRKACLMRLDGKTEEADAIMKDELPMQVRAWQGTSGFRSEELDELYTEERRRSGDIHAIIGEMENCIKNEMDSLYALGSGPVQIKLDGLRDKLDAVLPTLATTKETREVSAGLTEAVNSRIEAVLDRLVSAEAFEARMMSSVNMLYDAQSRALTEAVVAIRTTLEKRLTETTTPIYQRLSGLISVEDFSRLSRENTQKMSSDLKETLYVPLTAFEERTAAALEKFTDGMKSQRKGLANDLSEQLRATTKQTQETQGAVETGLRQIQSQEAEGLKTLAERLATLIIEADEKQKALLENLSREMTQAQTKALGTLAAGQQNFLNGLAQENEALKKRQEEIAARQKSIEGQMREVVELLKAQKSATAKACELPAVVEAKLEAFGKSIERKLTDAVEKKLSAVRAGK